MPQNTAPLVSWHGEHAKVPLPLRILGRYFITGRALRGPGDNATFFHRATVDYRARPYLRLTGPIWQRLARRHAAITIPLALLLAAPWHGLWPVALYETLLLLGAWAWGGRRTYEWWRGRRTYKQWIDPAARVACSVLGIRYTKRAGRAMITLPVGWGEGREEGGAERQSALLTLPPGVALTKRLKETLADNVGTRLGIPRPISTEWIESGPAVLVTLAAAPVPPKEVTWVSLEPAARAAGEEEIVIGRTAGGRIASISLAEDSPHIASSGASGTGKSVLARVMLAPRVAWYGDGLLITDPKKFSHWRWAGGGKVDSNRIRYAWRTEDLHQAWLDVAAEIQRRIELDEDELVQQRRVFILVEEINTQTKRLQRFWRAERKRIIVAAKLALADDPAADIDLGDLDPPVQSPAIVAMQESVAMGRELKMHVVAKAQRLSAGVFGGNGGDIRESFQGGRLLARWDKKLWKMLVDTIDYVACPSGPRGIWGLAKGDIFEILRVPFMSEAEALAMVTGQGVPAVHGPVLGQQTSSGRIDGQTVGHAELANLGHGQKQLANPVTLATALDMLPGQSGPRAITLATLRRASREPGFPEPLAKPDGSEYGRTETRLYDLQALADWREEALAGDL